MVDILHISQASTTPANNLAVQGVSTAEGWVPSSVNNWARALEAILAGFYADFGGLGTIGGTANAITLTNTVPIDSLRNGQIMALKNTSGPNTAAATLNVDGKGAKAIRLQADIALTALEMTVNGVYLFRYDTAYNAAAGAWVLLNPSQTSWGVTDGSGTTAGQIGELASATLGTGSATGLTTATSKTVISMSLTAGDWDVSGHVYFNSAATTSITIMSSCISLVDNTDDLTAGHFNEFRTNTAIVAGAVTHGHAPLGPIRISLAATTTLYLVARATFTISTLIVWGTIRARRIR